MMKNRPSHGSIMILGGAGAMTMKIHVWDSEI